MHTDSTATEVESEVRSGESLTDASKTSTDTVEPRYPTHPVLSLPALTARQPASVPTVLSEKSCAFFPSGRYALGKALELSGVGADDEVLVPAYCCPAMVSPITWLAAHPRFYRVTPELTPNLSDIASKFSPRTKALIGVHYFGFPRDFTELRAYCDERNVKLLEDCAHCFFGRIGRRPVGSWGHYAFASPMKFFPLFDGGCLVAADASKLTSPSERAGLLFELKAASNILERSYQYGRLPLRPLWSALFSLRTAIWRVAKPAKPPSHISPSSSDGGNEFQPAWLNRRMSIPSSVLLSMVAHGRVVERRRENYHAILTGLRDFKGVRPLYPELPSDVVPYVLPLVVDRPEVVYSHLKQAGVPVLRWDDAETTQCDVSRLYSKHLVFVACHQELSDEAVDWMLQELENALRS